MAEEMSNLLRMLHLAMFPHFPAYPPLKATACVYFDVKSFWFYHGFDKVNLSKFHQFGHVHGATCKFDSVTFPVYSKFFFAVALLQCFCKIASQLGGANNQGGITPGCDQNLG